MSSSSSKPSLYDPSTYFGRIHHPSARMVDSGTLARQWYSWLCSVRGIDEIEKDLILKTKEDFKDGKYDKFFSSVGKPFRSSDLSIDGKPSATTRNGSKAAGTSRVTKKAGGKKGQKQQQAKKKSSTKHTKSLKRRSSKHGLLQDGKKKAAKAA